ncbi:MAG: phosphoribosylaminoimidazolesuccinocarboxamide synthase [Burkholderiales bacterium]|nr:phosphoribosylaminoimidazolesuccinocarboxamide synthase [Burkholderiales bacterium]
MSNAPLYQTDLKSLPFLHRGKVRDIYAVGDDKLLVVQSDRLSAFDVILDDPIPGKGRVLTELSYFWFDKLKHIVPNHLTGIDPATVVAPNERDQIAGRAMVVKKYTPLLVEAVVRGYIIGSGWSDYQKTGAICGIKLPAGLKQAEKLAGPIFTPASKAPAGQHDENISYEDVVKTIGAAHTAKVKEISIQLYQAAAEFAATRGIIIADTKFEFGTDAAGNVVLIDEALTPDSSRFWPASEYRTGISPPSFDKQFVRDWLETQPWNKKAPAPRLPADVLKKTSEKYREAQTMLLGS